MNQERIRAELELLSDIGLTFAEDDFGFVVIPKGANPEDFTETVFISLFDDGCACVSYYVETEVELPSCDTLADLIDDLLDALHHIEAHKNALASNGGELPVGWCY